jgi:flagellar hook-associated protein 2
MAIQSGGIGSGLDINSLVAQLVAAERAPYQQRIIRQQQSTATQVSALGQFKGSVSQFQSSLSTLKDPLAFQVRSTKSSDDTIFTATATETAAASTYSIEVTQIAKSHRIASNAYASGSGHVVGTGTLTLSLGDTNMVLEIDSDNNTVAGIRDAINEASNNPGIRASIVLATDGAHLVLESTKTGLSNDIAVAQSGGDGGLASLTYSGPGDGPNYTELDPAQDAIVLVSGFSKQSATNTISGVIEGVTLTLKKEAPGAPESLAVTYNNTATTDRVKNFVTQYNVLATQLGKLRSYNKETGEAGPMLGDPMLNSIESSLRRDVTSAVPGLTGDYTSLASIGIRTNADGTLVVDSTKLQKAIDTDPTAVGNIFGSANGVANRVFAKTEKWLASDGQFATRSATLDKQSKDADKQIKALELRMAQIEARYRRQFNALDSMLANMQTQSAFLAQQLSSLSSG